MNRRDLVKALGAGLVTAGANRKSSAIPHAQGGFKAAPETFTLNAQTVVKLKDGRLLLMTGSMDARYSADRGRTWSESSPLIVEAGKKVPPLQFDGLSLIRLARGGLAVCYLSRNEMKGISLLFRKSVDEGKTWSTPVTICYSPPDVQPGYLSGFYDQMVQLSTGRLVVPLRWAFTGEAPVQKGESPGGYGVIGGHRFKAEGHGHVPEMDISFVYYSDDEGQTWSRSKGDLMGWTKDGWLLDCDEPNAAELPDGRLLMFFRGLVGRILVSYSEDQGVTWTLPEPSELASSTSPSRLRRIPGTNDLIAVWNHVSGDEIRRGYRRGRLVSAISSDSGKTWKHFKILEISPGLDKVPDVQPDPEIHFVRGRDELGELPDGFGIYHYPNLVFIDDQAFLMFGVHEYKLKADKSKLQHLPSHRLRVLPKKWFYET